MLTVDDFGRIRRAHRGGMSIRSIAVKFGHSRRSVRKALKHCVPKPYTQSAARSAPKLGPFHDVIDPILADDVQAPRKQRHTAELSGITFCTSVREFSRNRARVGGVSAGICRVSRSHDD